MLEVETSKTTIEVTSPAAGVIALRVSAGDEVEVGALLFEVDDGSADAMTPAGAGLSRTADESQADNQTAATGARFSKAALKALRERGLSESVFDGGAWVTAEQVAVAHRERSGVAPAVRTVAAAPVPAEAPHTGAAYVVQTTGKRKRAEIDNLSLANRHGTTSCIGISIDLPGPRVVAPPSLFEETIADLVVFEAAKLFAAYPDLNGFYLDGKTSAHYQTVNFGLSFDNGANLKVLAVENAQALPLSAIQERYVELLELYESERPLAASLLTSATVTLSDLSHTDAAFMLPLVNGRQSLILGLIRRDALNYQVYASFDHRLSEGRAVSLFLRELKERVVSYHVPAHPRLSCYACDKSMEQERAAGYRGFVKIVTPDGHERLLCNVCFSGW